MDVRVFPPYERPPVEVSVDGQWRPGFLHRWTRRPEGWFGYAHWTVAPGLTRVGEYHESELRPRE